MLDLCGSLRPNSSKLRTFRTSTQPLRGIEYAGDSNRVPRCSVDHSQASRGSVGSIRVCTSDYVQLHLPCPQQTLTFSPIPQVPITQQEAARGRGAAKRIVRAHVTRVQHAKSSTLSSTQDLQTWTVKPYIHRDAASFRRKPKVNNQKLKRDPDGSVEKPDDEPDPLRERALSILPMGHAGEDPFWTYPVAYQPYLAPIFAHCKLAMSSKQCGMLIV